MNEKNPGVSTSAPTVGESFILGVAAVAAYVAFGAFTLMHDPRGAAPRDDAAATRDARATADAASFASAQSQAAERTGVGIEALGRPSDAAGGNLHLQFIVKFKGEAATLWRDRYLADPDAARAAFAEMSETNPAFAGLRLERMTYGGEATLSFTGPAPADRSALEALSADIIRQLSAAADVEYAEPNLVGVREDTQ